MSEIKLTCLLAVVSILCMSLCMCQPPSLADGETPVIVIAAEATPTPEAPVFTPPPATPAPTSRPALGSYDYEGKDVEVRCGSRAAYSIVPDAATEIEKEALIWVLKNRQDDDSGTFPDEMRYVLLQGNEFMDYNPDAKRTQQNNEIAERVLNAWYYERLTGDTSYRLVQKSGVKCCFYKLDGNRVYIKVMDMGGNVVFDSATIGG